MINLFLSIVFTSCLIIFFRYFERYKVIVLQAIVVNYFVAGSMGLFNSSGIPEEGLAQQSWLKIALPLGALFISVFYTIALTTKKQGVSAATVANKMSVVIPVIAAFFLYGDSINGLKVACIILALAAVYFTNKKDADESAKKESGGFIFPTIVFLGSGIIDALVNYVQKIHLENKPPDLFLSITFYSAGTIGIFILASQYLLKKKKPEWKSLIAGICLGIPNYFSIYFFIAALNEGVFESSVLYPLNNIGIVVLSTLYSLIFFREKLSRMNWVGIGLAIISIILMNFS